MTLAHPSARLTMRNALLILAVALACLVSVLGIQTVLLVPKQVEADPVTDIVIDVRAVADHLAQAIRYRTISSEDSGKMDPKAFRGLHDFLARAFPKTHQTLRKETVAGHSLLFTWPGREDSTKPVLFLAHLDVVPVETGTGDLWSHPPFSGDVAEGYIWGRGSMDDKVRAMAMLEAVEALLQQGHTPGRTMIFAFGHDEEVGGYKGAAKMAGLLRDRGLRFESVFDEGGAIVTEGVLPGLSLPIALVGTAEKGFMNVELRVQGHGGHSSMPPAQTVLGILSSAIHRLEEQQFPSRLDGVTRKLAESIAPEMPFVNRIMLQNLWLFDWLVRRKFALQPATNALIRTTMATTIIGGGIQNNILPTRARATVNVRLLPGDTTDSALNRLAQIIDDSRVEIRPSGHSHEALVESSVQSWGFVTLKKSILQVFQGVQVAPFLVPSMTDSRHYAELSEGTFRFSPLLVGPNDLQRIHGANERISADNYSQCVRFYYQLIRNIGQ